MPTGTFDTRRPLLTTSPASSLWIALGRAGMLRGPHIRDVHRLPCGPRTPCIEHGSSRVRTPPGRLPYLNCVHARNALAWCRLDELTNAFVRSSMQSWGPVLLLFLLQLLLSIAGILVVYFFYHTVRNLPSHTRVPHAPTELLSRLARMRRCARRSTPTPPHAERELRWVRSLICCSSTCMPRSSRASPSF